MDSLYYTIKKQTFIDYIISQMYKFLASPYFRFFFNINGAKIEFEFSILEKMEKEWGSMYEIWPPN